jgi:hypothetical protein
MHYAFKVVISQFSSQRSTQVSARSSKLNREVPLTPSEVKEYGRRVGWITGFFGYLPASLCGGLLNQLFAHNPTATTPHNNDPAVIGASIGIILMLISAMIGVWIFKYPGRVFRVESSPSAFANAMFGLLHGATGVLLAFIIIVYAMGVVLMWLMAAGLLIFAIAD